MIDHFATSSDIRYAPRLRVMLESLWHHHPDATVTVLCLDQALHRWLQRWAGKRVGTIRSDTLEASDPRLRPLRRERELWEYYATLKPVFLHHLIRQIPPDSLLAFIDSDTCCFSPLHPLAEAMGKASIALSPHRFSPALADLNRYGRYNAGFGIWRHDPSGLKCLHDWSNDCIAWCHRQLEDGKFMNQGYLDRWPDRYPNVIELDHPGHNLAPWNLDRHSVTNDHGQWLIDGLPLLFFHFSHLFRNRRREWCILDKWPGLHAALPIQQWFGPYLQALDQAEAAMPWLLRQRVKRSLRQPKNSKAHLNLSQWVKSIMDA